MPSEYPNELLREAYDWLDQTWGRTPLTGPVLTDVSTDPAGTSTPGMMAASTDPAVTTEVWTGSSS
ncbi:hypothetical protein ACLQ24_30675, partial [Micromonospora sp. DT4]|uniref:hypothetical protein n=1 Tax=Micromonospora sp. DT4 TaxID=3393438 RepID=UPI003CFABF57